VRKTHDLRPSLGSTARLYIAGLLEHAKHTCYEALWTWIFFAQLSLVNSVLIPQRIQMRNCWSDISSEAALVLKAWACARKARLNSGQFADLETAIGFRRLDGCIA